MKTKLFFLACALAGALIHTTLDSAEVIDRTVAIVNGEHILLSDLEKITGPTVEIYRAQASQTELTDDKIKELKQNILDQLINDRLLLQQAKKDVRIKISKRELEQGMAHIKSRFKNDAEFKAELLKEKITEKKFNEKIEEQLMALKLIDLEIKSKVTPPGDSEIRSLFGKIKKVLDGQELKDESEDDKKDIETIARIIKKNFNERIRARHVLIRTSADSSMSEQTAARKKIEEIKEKVKKGEDFLELAQKHSDDKGSARNGGDLGYFTRGDMVPEFEKAAFSLGVGEMSDIVRTEFGYHLIMLEEKKAAQKVSLELVQNDLSEYLMQKAAEKKYASWIKGLRAKASVKINPIE
ncbi:MAG: peptidylprolyl isomerase [Elusimicrobiota bacterium]